MTRRSNTIEISYRCVAGARQRGAGRARGVADTTSSNQHLQIHKAFPGRFRGGRKIKKFVEESDLIPVAFMVMPGCVYSTIQFIFFSLRLISFFPKLSILRISFRTVLYSGFDVCE